MNKSIIVKLTDVCKDIFAGGDVPKDNYSSKPNDIYCIPIYTNGEQNAGLYGFTTKARVFEPSLTVSARGTIGFTAIRTTPFFPAIRLITLTPNEKIDIKYLFYVTQNYKFENGGTSIPQLTVPMLKSYTFPLPSLEIQKQIAATLDKVTRTIDLCNAILEKLDLLVKARFVEMFGDPVTNDMNWQTHSVEEVCSDIYGGGTPSKAHPEYYENGNIPWVSSKDMKADIITESQIYINQLGVENSTTKMVPVNSVIMVIRSGILKHTLPVAINAVPITVNQDLKVFIPDDCILALFLSTLFKMLEKDILSGVRAVTADNIEFNSLKQRQIIVPPIELQTQFAAFVEQTDKSKLAVKKVLEKAETLKKALMQEYFG